MKRLNKHRIDYGLCDGSRDLLGIDFPLALTLGGGSEVDPIHGGGRVSSHTYI